MGHSTIWLFTSLETLYSLTNSKASLALFLISFMSGMSSTTSNDTLVKFMICNFNWMRNSHKCSSFFCWKLLVLSLDCQVVWLDVIRNHWNVKKIILSRFNEHLTKILSNTDVVVVLTSFTEKCHPFWEIWIFLLSKIYVKLILTILV